MEGGHITKIRDNWFLALLHTRTSPAAVYQCNYCGEQMKAVLHYDPPDNNHYGPPEDHSCPGLEAAIAEEKRKREEGAREGKIQAEMHRLEERARKKADQDEITREAKQRLGMD